MSQPFLLIILAGLGVYLYMKTSGSDSVIGQDSQGNDITINDLITKWATYYAVPASLVWGIIKEESDFDPNAIGDEGQAVGLMQLHPGVCSDFGEPNANRKDPDKNIQIGTWYLSRFLSKYDQDTTIQMFNVGENGYLFEGKRNQAYLDNVNSYINQASV